MRPTGGGGAIRRHFQQISTTGPVKPPRTTVRQAKPRRGTIPDRKAPAMKGERKSATRIY
jgi:hypothetical protein